MCNVLNLFISNLFRRIRTRHEIDFILKIVLPSFLLVAENGALC
jgi:hypothetical protein